MGNSTFEAKPLTPDLSAKNPENLQLRYFWWTFQLQNLPSNLKGNQKGCYYMCGHKYDKKMEEEEKTWHNSKLPHGQEPWQKMDFLK